HRAQAEREAAALREKEAKETAERAERQRQEAEERAQRQAEQAEAARAQRHQREVAALEHADEWPLTHDPSAAQVQGRIDELARVPLDAFEEFATEAEQARDATLTRLRAMLAEAQDLERRQAETLEQERQRQADTAAAAKVKAQQDADRAEQEKRAANRAHRARINRDAAAAIVLVMSELHPGTAEQAQDIAIAVVTAIAKGEIPAVQIQY
ncbi:MAG: hypothetical protein ACHQ7M_13830, partial [Chloroflexota bacterium]